MTRKKAGREKWRQSQEEPSDPSHVHYHQMSEYVDHDPMGHKRLRPADYSVRVDQPNRDVPADAVRCRRRHPVMRTRCVREAGHATGTCWDINVVGWPTQADMGFLRGKKGEDGKLLGNRRERRNAGRLKVMKRRAK